jgi:hypothetical protein
MSLLLPLLFACTTSSTPVAPTGTGQGSGGPATGTGTGGGGTVDTGIAGPGLPEVDAPQTEPTWAAADVQAALAAALADGLPDPRYEHDQYLALLSHGTEACPGHETYIDDRFVYGCNAESGYYYSGVSNYLTSDETVGGARTVEIEVNGDFLFRDDEDRFFEVGGHSIQRTTWPADGGSGERWLEHSGTWHWEAHESWLRDGASGRFSMTLSKDGADRVLGIEGAIGFGGTWMAFDHVVLAEGACAWAPTGAVELRDPGGAWHRVDFGESCSPCGALVFDRDTPLGEVCVDLSTIPLALGDAWGDL